MKKFTLVTVLIIVLISSACAQATPPPPTATSAPHPGKALTESRCTTCHPLTIISTVKYDPAGWEFTVKRMVASGAALDAEQQAQVVDYLATTYK